jgi:ribokinase
MKPIVVVGSINMDMVSTAKRAPLPGETVFGTDFQMYSGGKGANQAVTVARLGYPVILLGKVGQDIFGTQLLEILSGYGVDISEVERTSGTTGTASIVVDANGENSIIVTPAANLQVTPAYVESKQQILEHAGMVLTQLEVPLDTVRRLAQLCDALNVPLMLDPSPAQPLDEATLSKVSWFTPNQTEARFYVDGFDGTVAALDKVSSLGVRNLILKKGSEGALIANGDGSHYRVAAIPVEAIDTTAAGDCFNGAFAVALLRGGSIKESAKFAAAAAAITVTRNGAQSSLPAREDVELLLGSLDTDAPSRLAGINVGEAPGCALSNNLRRIPR